MSRTTPTRVRLDIKRLIETYKIDPVLAESVLEPAEWHVQKAADQLVVQLMRTVLANETVTEREAIYVPTSWWQHLKADLLPTSWQRGRLAPRCNRVVVREVWRMCPHHRVPVHGTRTHLQFMMNPPLHDAAPEEH